MDFNGFADGKINIYLSKKKKTVISSRSFFSINGLIKI